MALDDVDSSRHYWYNSAYADIDGGITSTSFGSGKQNTQTMIAKWNSGAYGPINDGKYTDMWGLSAVQSGTWNGSSGWYVPSRGEWGAFADQLGITKSNYANKGLAGSYWSSSHIITSMAWSANFDYGYMFSDNLYGYSNKVRLGATF